MKNYYFFIRFLYYFLCILSSYTLALPQDNNGANTTDFIDTPAKTCTPGVNVGYMLIRQPNITSSFIVGKSYNISWDWSITVSKYPSYLDAYTQLLASGIKITWKNIIAEKIPTSPQWFIWTPNGLADGKYKIRLVPDGKETFNVRADAQPCFSNGESIPSVSAAFSISNSRGDLNSYSDPYPPNSNSIPLYKIDMFGSVEAFFMFLIGMNLIIINILG